MITMTVPTSLFLIIILIKIAIIFTKGKMPIGKSRILMAETIKLWKPIHVTDINDQMPC